MVGAQVPTLGDSVSHTCPDSDTDARRRALKTRRKRNFPRGASLARSLH